MGILQCLKEDNRAFKHPDKPLHSHGPILLCCPACRTSVPPALVAVRCWLLQSSHQVCMPSEHWLPTRAGKPAQEMGVGNRGLGGSRFGGNSACQVLSSPVAASHPLSLLDLVPEKSVLQGPRRSIAGLKTYGAPKLPAQPLPLLDRACSFLVQLYQFREIDRSGDGPILSILLNWYHCILTNLYTLTAQSCYAAPLAELVFHQHWLM